jgi:hypothetical protein
MPLSVRLDPRMEQVVRRLAHRQRRTRSAIVRQAIAAFAKEQAAGAGEPSTPWNAMQHLVGVADSRGRQLSEETGSKFRSVLQAKADARRSR